MWLLKKKKPVEERAVPKCGLMSHYDWTTIWTSCPLCEVIDRERMLKSEREKIADLVVGKLKSISTGL